MKQDLESKKHQGVDTGQPPAQQLELLEEAKISDLLPDAGDMRFEASGVAVKDGFFYVIFDDSTDIGCIKDGLGRATEENHLIQENQGGGAAYEAIPHEPLAHSFS